MEGVLDWRAKRDASLRTKDGWLTLVGLDWLKIGDNTIGNSSSGCSIVFPTCDTPFIGTTTLTEEGKTFFTPHEGVSITADGNVVESKIELQSDQNDNPTTLKHKSLTWFVIKRGNRYGLRVKDSEAEVLKNFHGNQVRCHDNSVGMDYFEIDLSYRVEATFEPHPEPVTLKIPTAIGEDEEVKSYGNLIFELGGQLLALEDPKEKLWLIFRDQTTGKETYGGGRFLWSSGPVENNKVTLDFNTAYNPPCVFTPYATCPYPPSENELPVAVNAGEKKFHD